MKQHKKWIGMLAAGALILTACGNGDDGDAAGNGNGDNGNGEGASGEPVPIGGIFDLSGPTGDAGTPYAEGVRAYVDWRNDSQDGVGGRPLELEWQDYAYDVATAEQLYSQFASQGVVAIQGWGTGDTEALRQQIVTDEIVWMSTSLDENLVDPEYAPYNFIVGTTYSDQMRIVLRWIEEDAGGQTEVAVFHHDSPFGMSPVGDGADYVNEENLEIGYDSYAMATGATDYVGDLSRAQSQGAEYIIIQNVHSPAAQLVRDIQDQGLDMQVICLSACTGELFLELAGDTADGVFGIHPFSSPTGDEEGLNPLREYLEGQGENLEDQDMFFVHGWFNTHVMAEAMTQLVEAGEDVTGEALRAHLESMDPIDLGDVGSEVDFSADSHRGMTAANFFEVEGGMWEKREEGVTP